MGGHIYLFKQGLKFSSKSRVNKFVKLKDLRVLKVWTTTKFKLFYQVHNTSVSDPKDAKSINLDLGQLRQVFLMWTTESASMKRWERAAGGFVTGAAPLPSPTFKPPISPNLREGQDAPSK